MSDDALERFLDELYPYRGESETYRRIPESGRTPEDVLAEVRSYAGREDAMGDAGRVSGSLYCGDHDHYHALSEVFEVCDEITVLRDGRWVPTFPNAKYIFHKGEYASTNLLYYPAENLMIGGEVLYGSRTNNDDQDGDAFRFQFTVKYNFGIKL